MRRSAEKRLRLPLSESARVPVGGVVLTGHLEIPRDATGLVLFAHGSGSSRHSPRNQFVARVLRDAGSGTLLFDLLTQDEEWEDAVTGHLRSWLSDWRLPRTGRPCMRSGSDFLLDISDRAQAAQRHWSPPPRSVRALMQLCHVVYGRISLAMPLPMVKAPTLLIVGERDEEVLRLMQASGSKIAAIGSLEPGRAVSILSLASAGECGTIHLFWGEQQATETLVSVVCIFSKRRLSPCSIA